MDLKQLLRHQGVDAQAELVIAGVFVVKAQRLRTVAEQAKRRLGRHLGKPRVENRLHHLDKQLSALLHNLAGHLTHSCIMIIMFYVSEIARAQ